MNDSFESAHAAGGGLVDNFAANEAYYLFSGYSEARARVSFIDQFWTLPPRACPFSPRIPVPGPVVRPSPPVSRGQRQIGPTKRSVHR